MLWCFWDDLPIAIAVIDQAADFYNDTKRLMFVSAMYGFLIVVSAIITLVGVIYFYSMFERQYDASLVNPQTNFRAVPGTIQYVLLGVLFIGSWIENFCAYMLGFVAMYSTASYYWSGNAESSKDGEADVLTGLRIGHTKHFGSIAIASLIAAIMDALESATEDKNGNASPLANIYTTCCMSLLGAVIEALNDIAIANMAISGDKFCTSAMNGFMLTLRHLGKFYLADTIGKFIIMIGKGFIVALTVGFTVLIMVYTNKEEGSSAVIGIVLLALINLCVVLVINRLFLGLFDEAIVCTL